MGWFWADNADSQKKISPVATKSSSSIPPSCPMHNASASSATLPIPPKRRSGAPPAACPVVGKDGAEDLNPLNNMPYDISTQKASGQTIDLPTERTLSTIPRGDKTDEGVWEYPSPQQMLNAMLRKGKGDIPEDAVEDMVNIHNFLNEGAWGEILEWEKKYTDQTDIAPRLQKFTGRPHDLSPRARMYSLLAAVLPSYFEDEKPFDRHDWTVLRGDKDGSWKEVRYVIDYYGGPDDEHGMPTFFLDVRPALDNFGNASDRMSHWLEATRPTWDKALGRSSNNTPKTN
ncbi:hypothetical protein B5S28_g280 [[Candida] boidinii]|uniref:Unnamed protein product n=1 Tax=Candida boidinii TaxID=5477 RepID=A0ACB5THC5_CANBO|nr:hypothetical protein B5S28_g280 [[Candida] boidinii]GME88387.1 unnamed protein product [[Candida] boidinii]